MSQLSTPTKKSKMPVLLILLVVLAVAVFAAKFIFEKKAVEHAERDLKMFEPYITIKADKITASLFSRSITYDNVVVEIPDLGVKNVSAKLEYSGIDFSSFIGNPGAITTIAKGVMHDTTSYLDAKALGMPELQSIYGDNGKFGHVELYEFDNLKYAYKDMRSVMKDSKGSDPVMLIKKMLPLLASAHVDTIRMKNYSYSIDGCDILMKSAESRDVSIMRMGSSATKDISVTVNGTKVASVAAIGMDGFQLPKLVAEVLKDVDGFMGSILLRMEQMQERPYELLDGLNIDNIYVKGLDINVPNKLQLKSDNFGFSLRVREKDGEVKTEIAGLSFDKEILRSLFKSDELLNMLPATPMFNANFAAKVQFTSPLARIICSLAMSEKELGGASNEVSYLIPMENLLRGQFEDEILLESSNVTLENHGLAKVIFQAIAISDGYSIDRVYSDFEEALQAAEAAINSDTVHKLTANLRLLVINGGTMNIDIKPAAPIKLDASSLPQGDDALPAFIDQLGISVNYKK